MGRARHRQIGRRQRRRQSVRDRGLLPDSWLSAHTTGGANTGSGHPSASRQRPWRSRRLRQRLAGGASHGGSTIRDWHPTPAQVRAHKPSRDRRDRKKRCTGIPLGHRRNPRRPRPTAKRAGAARTTWRRPGDSGVAPPPAPSAQRLEKAALLTKVAACQCQARVCAKRVRDRVRATPRTQTGQKAMVTRGGWRENWPRLRQRDSRALV